MWEIRVSHEGLHTYRVVRGATKEEAHLRARLQKEAWEARWARVQAADAALQERIKKRNWTERQADIDRRAKNEALKLTKQAEADLDVVRSLLSSSLLKTHVLDWKSLKDTRFYTKPDPPEPELKALPTEPAQTEERFRPEHKEAKIRLIDWILPRARQKKQSEAESINRSLKNESDKQFQRAHADWKKAFEEIRKVH